MKLFKSVLMIGAKIAKPFVISKLKDKKFKNHLITKLNLKINIPGMNEDQERALIKRIIEETVDFIDAI